MNVPKSETGIACVNRSIWLGMCLLLAACGNRSDAEAEALSGRLLREAPVKWLEYRKLVIHCAGEGRVIATHADKSVDIDEWSFSIDGANMLRRERLGDDSDVQGTWGANPAYQFLVRRRKGEAGWTLLRLVPVPGSIPADYIGDKMGGSRDLILPNTAFARAMGDGCRGQFLDDKLLPRLLESSAFSILRVAKPKDHPELVKVEFAYEPPEAEKNNDMGGGFVVLDPRRYWLVCELETRDYRGSGIITLANEFDDTSMPFPYVKRQVRRAAWSENGKQLTTEYVFEGQLRLPVKDESQYTLTAYGLPEPDVRSRPGWERWRLVCMAIAPVILFLALLAWRSLQRSRTASADGAGK